MHRRAPVIIRPDEVVRQGRDAQGRRTKRVLKRDTEHGGRLGGWEHFHAAGNNDAHIAPQTVRVTMRASDFGMTPRELAAVLERDPLRSRERRTAAGLFLP